MVRLEHPIRSPILTRHATSRYSMLEYSCPRLHAHTHCESFDPCTLHEIEVETDRIALGRSVRGSFGDRTCRDRAGTSSITPRPVSGSVFSRLPVLLPNLPSIWLNRNLKPSKYGFMERVADSVTVHIGKMHIHVRTLGKLKCNLVGPWTPPVIQLVLEKIKYCSTDAFGDVRACTRRKPDGIIAMLRVVLLVCG